MVKEPWQMTRANVREIAEAGGQFIDTEGTAWQFTGKKEQLGLTYVREAINPATGQRINISTRTVLENHKMSVEQALAEDKPVPDEVLADYPDLGDGLANND